MAAEAIPLIKALLDTMGLTAAGSAKGTKYDIPSRYSKREQKKDMENHIKRMEAEQANEKKALSEEEKALSDEEAQAAWNELIHQGLVTPGSQPLAPIPEPDPDDNKDKKNKKENNDSTEKDARADEAERGRARWGKEEYVDESKIMKNRPSQGKLPHELKPTDKLLPAKESKVLPKHNNTPVTKTMLEHKELSPEEHAARELNYRIEHPSVQDRYSPEELANLLSKLTKHGGPKIKGILSFLGAGALASKGNKAEAEEMPEVDEGKALEVSKRTLKDLNDDQKEELFGNLEYIYSLIGSKDKADVELGRQMLEDLAKDYDLNFPTAEEEPKKKSYKNSGVITGNVTEDTNGIIGR